MEVWNIDNGSATDKIDQQVASTERPVTQAEAAKALNEIYEGISTAPKYLRVSHLIKDYNVARGKYDQSNFSFVIHEADRIRKLLDSMKEQYNEVALNILKAQEQLQGDQKTGFQMEFEKLFKMLDHCTQTLKRGELDTSTQMYGRFNTIYAQQRERSIEPLRNDALRILGGVSNLIQQAKYDGLDTTKAEERYNEIKGAVDQAQQYQEFQSLVEQVEDVKDLIEYAWNEKKLKDEIPKKISASIQGARIELINLKKENMDIDSLIDFFDNVSNMFMNADDTEEFDRVQVQIGKLNGLIKDKQAALAVILKDREELNNQLDKRRQKCSELTHKGYLMAAMLNKVEKISKKLNGEASQDALKQTKRFISNFDGELTSIEAQDIDEFNLRIALLSDFEELSDLYDKLKDDIDEAMEFLVEFSMIFSEATSIEDFKGMNAKMRVSLNLVKTALGMSLDEDDQIPAEEERILEEFQEVEGNIPPPPAD